jgi:hypothetical protein
MLRPPFRLTSIAVLLVAAPLFMTGCPKKPPPPVEVEAAAEPEVIDAGVTQLEPLDEDSGPEAGPPVVAKRGGGGGGGVNAARIRQCCNGMRKQATGMGPSPEANVLLGLAMQCDLLAAQAAGGTAPEFGAFRQMLAGRTLPAACSGM